MKKLNAVGDTIVEVLIVIAIISLVLTAAFVTSNRSYKTVQDAQEHGVAQSLVTGQLEDLQALHAKGSDNIFTAFSGGFCLNQVGGFLGMNNYTSNACQVNGRDVHTATEPVYNIKITRTCIPGTCGKTTEGWVFTVQATWASVIDSSTNNVTMYYRVYREVSSS